MDESLPSILALHADKAMKTFKPMILHVLGTEILLCIFYCLDNGLWSGGSYSLDDAKPREKARR